MADSKIKLTKADRFKAFLRSYFLLASFNYERMQNGGVAYTLIPAIKKLYQTKEDRVAALKRHLEFFNTQPFMANPTLSGLHLPWKKNVLTGRTSMMPLSQGLRLV